MDYMLILTHDPAASTESSTPATVFDDWTAYTRALRDAGVLIAGAALHAQDTATTVRVREEKVVVTDGPFIEAKEQIIGYYVIRADDLDTALAWAGRVPNVVHGAVEVRPIAPGSSVDEVVTGAG